MGMVLSLLLLSLILDVIQVVVVKDNFLYLLFRQKCWVKVSVFHLNSTCLHDAIHLKVLLVNVHLFLQHKEIHHLMEHRQTILCNGASTLPCFCHLICSLLGVYLKGADSFSKISNLFIYATQFLLECLLKNLQ